jgi:hypothetical protein
MLWWQRVAMMLGGWARFVGIGIAAAAVVAPATAHAQATDAYGATSLARIRAALVSPPPRLHVPPPSTGVTPMFHVEVTQYFSMRDPFDEPPADPTWGLPSAGELMMGGIGKLQSAVSGYKKRRARGKAKREVSDALGEFCAVNACPPPPNK